MTKQDIDKAFFEAIEDKNLQEKAGIETRQLYEMRSERRYTTIAARLEILYKAGLLELKKNKMDLLAQRQKSNEELLQNRFIARILQEEAQNVSEEQVKLMVSRGFTSPEFFSERTFNVNDTILRYEHLAKHRFVDMRTRQTKTGVRKKVSHAVHNKILFGHANNIVFRLSFEYTSRMKTMLAQEFNIEL